MCDDNIYPRNSELTSGHELQVIPSASHGLTIWTARRRAEAVGRINNGESLDVVANDYGVDLYNLQYWCATDQRQRQTLSHSQNQQRIEGVEDYLAFIRDAVESTADELKQSTPNNQSDASSKTLFLEIEKIDKRSSLTR